MNDPALCYKEKSAVSKIEDSFVQTQNLEKFCHGTSTFASAVNFIRSTFVDCLLC